MLNLKKWTNTRRVSVVKKPTVVLIFEDDLEYGFNENFKIRTGRNAHTAESSSSTMGFDA